MRIVNTVIRNNTLQNGQMFDLKHNFRLTLFLNCLIEYNKGYFLQVSPRDVLLLSLSKQVRFKSVRMYRNTGKANALIHISKNSYFAAYNSEFIENVAFGRGVIIFSEQKKAQIDMLNCTFIRNSGIQGGVFFTDNLGELFIEKSYFEQNFAFQGGIGYIQDNGYILLSSNKIVRNFAYQASILILFNSPNFDDMQRILGCEFTQNGFIYQPNFSAEQFRQAFENNIQWTNVSSNEDFNRYMLSQQEKIRELSQVDQYTNNQQIQLVNSYIQLLGQTVVHNQLSLIKGQGLSYISLLNIQILDIQNVQGSFIFIDQSDLTIELVSFKNFSMNDSDQTACLFNAQSESRLTAVEFDLTEVQGKILYLKGSNANFTNTYFENIRFSPSQNELFNLILGQITFQDTTINEIRSNEASTQTIIKAQNSKIFTDRLFASNMNQSFITTVNSKISMQNSTIENSTNLNAQGLILNAYETEVLISECIFKNIKGKRGSGIYFANNKNSVFTKILNITSCEFNNIVSNVGGAIYTQEGISVIKNNKFDNNTAGQSGASLYLSCTTTLIQQCYTNVKNNSFIGNSATTKGGAIFYDLNQPDGLQENVFENNSAPYGNNYASFPTSIKLYNKDISYLQSLVSGRNIENKIVIGLYDQDGQLYNIDSESDCKIFSDDIKLSISGVTKVRAQNGLYNFSKDINIIGYPDYQSKFEFSSSAIDDSRIASILTSNINSGSNLEIPIYFRQCIPGEVTQNNKCVRCIKGFYSFNPLNSTCEQCLSSAYCPGGTDLMLYPGTWRESYQSTSIYRCLNDKACLGGLNSTCATGYKGILCSECFGFSNGTKSYYAKSSGTKCTLCKTKSEQLRNLSYFLIVWSCYLFYILFNLLNNPTRNKPQTVLIRIFTNYLQVITLVRSFDLQWPHLVQEMLNYYVSIMDSQSQFLSLDCLLHDFSSEFVPSYFLKVITIGLSPFILVILTLPIWFLIAFVGRFKKCVPWSQSLKKDNLAENRNAQEGMDQLRKPEQQQQNEKNNNFKQMQPADKACSFNGESNIQQQNSFIFPEPQTNKSFLHQDIPSQSSFMIVPDRRKEQSFTPTEYSVAISSKPQNLIRAAELTQQISVHNERQQENIDNSPVEEDAESSTGFIYSLDWESFLTTFLVIILLWHPTIVNSSLNVFLCIEYNDEFYLRADTSLKCWEGRNYFLQLTVGLVFSIAWAIVFPLFIYWNIQKRALKLDERENLKLFGIFYIGLENDAFYWEIVVVNLRKITLIVISLFFSKDKQSLRGYLGIIFLFVQRHVSHYKTPFMDPRFNDIEHLSSLASIFTIIAGILFLPEGSGSGINGRSTIQQENETIKAFIFAIVLFFNVYFFVIWAYTYLSVLFRVHFKRIQQVAKYLCIKLPDTDSYDLSLQKYKELLKKDKDEKYSHQIILKQAPLFEDPLIPPQKHIPKNLLAPSEWIIQDATKKGQGDKIPQDEVINHMIVNGSVDINSERSASGGSDRKLIQSSKRKHINDFESGKHEGLQRQRKRLIKKSVQQIKQNQLVKIIDRSTKVFPNNEYEEIKRLQRSDFKHNETSNFLEAQRDLEEDQSMNFINESFQIPQEDLLNPDVNDLRLADPEILSSSHNEKKDMKYSSFQSQASQNQQSTFQNLIKSKSTKRGTAGGGSTLVKQHSRENQQSEDEESSNKKPTIVRQLFKTPQSLSSSSSSKQSEAKKQ